MDRTARIRQLNDAFRRGDESSPVFYTEFTITRRVAAFGNAFDEDNAPYGEHDFGSFEIDNQNLFWKIDYYELDLEYGSPDPSDPSVTRRVLTILLANEY